MQTTTYARAMLQYSTEPGGRGRIRIQPEAADHPMAMHVAHGATITPWLADPQGAVMVLTVYGVAAAVRRAVARLLADQGFRVPDLSADVVDEKLARVRTDQEIFTGGSAA